MKQPLQPTTIAILGTDSLSERILALLLEDEGYDTRRIETERAGLADELLDGINVPLLAPGLSTARHSTSHLEGQPETARTPLLTLPASIEEARDAESGTLLLPLPSPIAVLQQQIEAILDLDTGK